MDSFLIKKIAFHLILAAIITFIIYIGIDIIIECRVTFPSKYFLHHKVVVVGFWAVIWGSILVLNSLILLRALFWPWGTEKSLEFWIHASVYSFLASSFLFIIIGSGLASKYCAL